MKRTTGYEQLVLDCYCIQEHSKQNRNPFT